MPSTLDSFSEEGLELMTNGHDVLQSMIARTISSSVRSDSKSSF